MRIDGSWAEDDTGFRRPFVHAKLEAASGAWIECPFLIDTGADRTVLNAPILDQLGQPTSPAPKQLAGVGGGVETVEVWTRIRFTRTDGHPATIGAAFAAFTDPVALEDCVLGLDVLTLFAVILDQPGDTVTLIRDRHQYVIQES